MRRFALLFDFPEKRWLVMAYRLKKEAFDALCRGCEGGNRLFASKCYPAGGAFSDTDPARYGEIFSAGEIVFGAKSANSFKEALLPAAQTLFISRRVRSGRRTPRAQGQSSVSSGAYCVKKECVLSFLS